MKIVEGKTTQADPKYGTRAGKQCMANCFAFLHTVYLNGINKLLNADGIESVLNEGFRLDNATLSLLRAKQPGSLPDYRLITDIPKTITSRFGITHHELSKAFNGTLETQTIGGETYLGLVEFILYAKKKSPAFTVITIGVVTRAMFILNNTIYMFDPHPTHLKDTASIYITNSYGEIYDMLSEAYIDALYYDAAFVYFIDITNVVVSGQQASILTLKTYKDPDISLSINDFVSVDFERFFSIPGAEELSPSKRKADSIDALDEKKSKQSSIDIYSNFSKLTLLPSLHQFDLDSGTIFKDLQKYPLAKNSFDWTIYLVNEKPHKAFEATFILNRVFHLLAQVSDQKNF